MSDRRPETHEPADDVTVSQPSSGGEQPAGSEMAETAPEFAGTERYHPVEVIARGGMGVVWRARDRAFDRDVGLKTLLRVPAAGSVVAARFREEARITAQLQHPNIPPAHDLGTLPDGRPFLAMKLIKGSTLDELLRQRSDPIHGLGRLLAVFEQVAQAVAYAHARKVIHRDLKPHNVMVGNFGEVQVMDWGLAKVLSDLPASTAVLPTQEAAVTPEVRSSQEGEGSDRTSAGSVLGTPAYMPREQAIGAVDQVDTRSDVFSLGGILCAILTGHPPYVAPDGESARQLAALAKLDSAFARLDACKAEPDLVALCKKCLAPERADRPTDADAVARAVADLRASAERRAREAELDRVRAEGERAKAELHAREQRKLRRAQLALLVAGLLLAAGVGAAAWWSERQEAQRKVTAERESAERRAVEAQAKAEREAAEARFDGERQAESRAKAAHARDRIVAARRLADELRGQQRFGPAEAVLAQAAELAASAPELLPEITQARRDLAFVVRLDDIKYQKAVWVQSTGTEVRLKIASIPDEYRQAFASHGLDLAADGTAERIRVSPVRAEIVQALDDWSLFATGRDELERILRVARAADPGDWSDQLRDPAVRRDKPRLRAFAEQTNPERVASSSLATLAALLERAGIDPVPLLTLSQVHHPDDFQLNFMLARRLTFSNPQRAAPYYYAARALRPTNVTVLGDIGVFFTSNGDYRPALAAFQKEVQLDPKNATAHAYLGFCLQKEGKTREAVKAYQTALTLDSRYTYAYAQLGFAWRALNESEKAHQAFQRAAELNPKQYGNLPGSYPPIPLAPAPREVKRP